MKNILYNIEYKKNKIYLRNKYNYKSYNVFKKHYTSAID